MSKQPISSGDTARYPGHPEFLPPHSRESRIHRIFPAFILPFSGARFGLLLLMVSFQFSELVLMISIKLATALSRKNPRFPYLEAMLYLEHLPFFSLQLLSSSPIVKWPDGRQSIPLSTATV